MTNEMNLEIATCWQGRGERVQSNGYAYLPSSRDIAISTYSATWPSALLGHHIDQRFNSIACALQHAVSFVRHSPSVPWRMQLLISLFLNAFDLNWKTTSMNEPHPSLTKTCKFPIARCMSVTKQDCACRKICQYNNMNYFPLLSLLSTEQINVRMTTFEEKVFSTISCRSSQT